MKIIFIICIIVCAASCKPAWKSHVAEYADRASDDATIEPDYSSVQFWAAHPAKKDPSDSVPAFLKKNFQLDTTADVFFIYPTTYTDKQMPFGWNAPLLNPELNSKTDYTSILYQASIFNGNNIYAPRYRQANLDVYFTNDTATAIKTLLLAYADIKKAFTFYLQHHNHGKPIIIAAHSQGTTHAKWLLRDFFDGKPLQEQLVVTYIIGLPVEPNWFTNLRPCITPDQTGCFCSWRTFKTGYVTTYVKNEKFTAITTNPLTWDANQPNASRSKNAGGVLLKFNKRLPKVTDASIHDGVLWVQKPHFFGNIFLRMKNYHVADLNLFYMNIRQNTQQRVQAWRKMQK